jgi:hypothetical protein
MASAFEKYAQFASDRQTSLIPRVSLEKIFSKK